MGLDLSCRPEFANPWFLRLDVKARVNRMDTGKGRQMWRGGEQGRLEPMTWDVCQSLIAFKSLASEMHKSCRRSGTFYFCAKPTCDPGIGRNDRRFLGTRVAAGLAAAPWPWGKSANKLQLCLVLLSWLTFWVQNAYGFCFCSAIQNSAKWLGPSLTWNNIRKEILTDLSCLAKWFSQVHTDENILEELTLKLGVEHGWGFSSWSASIESSDSMICEWCFQVTQIQSSKGKRNNLFFCVLNIGKIYFLKFFTNYFHQNPDVSSETQLNHLPHPLQDEDQPSWQGNPPFGQGGWSIHAALGI